MGLALANIFPESHKLSGIGEGGSCTGLGAAHLSMPGDTAVVDIKLFR